LSTSRRIQHVFFAGTVQNALACQYQRGCTNTS
jgi:hypothetical protein